MRHHDPAIPVAQSQVTYQADSTTLSDGQALTVTLNPDGSFSGIWNKQ